MLLVAAPLRADAPVKPVGADLAAMVAGGNEFAFSLYGRLRAAKGDLFVSPLSISTALAMTYSGARGATATEMAGALRFTLPPEKLHPAFQDLLGNLNGEAGKGGLELHIANALWVDKQFKLLDEFVKVCGENYSAGVQAVDFQNQPDPARKTINAWVAKRTNDKIPELLAQRTITPDARLVLTNAVYFKSAWKNTFERTATKDDVFYAAGGKEQKMPLMHMTARLAYAEHDSCRILEMPYKDDATSMVVVLPDERDGLAALEARINAKWMAFAVAALDDRQVAVTLPRFTTRYTRALNDDLAALGMRSAFTHAADFSGIDGERDLFISLVVHQAFVDVNEQGTEAAAATAVVAELMTSIRSNPAEFRADHPFIYLIRHRVTGAILFLGKLEG
jgi:serpin B